MLTNKFGKVGKEEEEEEEEGGGFPIFPKLMAPNSSTASALAAGIKCCGVVCYGPTSYLGSLAFNHHGRRDANFFPSTVEYLIGEKRRGKVTKF